MHLTRGVMVAAILLNGAAADLSAQAGVIRGRVIRADEPVGVANAELVLTPSGATTRSDARGHFTIVGVTPGDLELSARRPGFIPATMPVRVSAVATTQIEIRLAPFAPVLDPVVTSATALTARSMEQIPGAVSVADSSAIQRGRMVGLHETLRNMPGVQVASRYGTEDANIGIRGSAARARNAVRGIGVLLDGVPLTEPDGVAGLDMIELAAARQIEVVRGPASALYAGSPGGVINVVSRTGRDSPGITARAQQGSFGFRKYDAIAGGVIADGRASAIAAASQTTTDGYRSHSEAEISRAQAGLDYVTRTGTRIALQAVGSRLDTRLPGSISQPEFDANPRAASRVATASNFGRDHSRYRAGAQLDKAFGSAAANAYLFYGRRNLDLPIVTQIVDLDLSRIQGGGRFRSARIAGLPLDATAGFDYDNVTGFDRRWANNAGVPGTLRDDGRFGVPGFGAYTQLEWQASAGFATTVGLRYDRVRYWFESNTANAIPRQETTFDQLSPRLATVWHPDAATSVYGSVGRGFETPAIGELSPSPGAALRPVRAKSLWNYEVGARRLIANRVRLEGAAFVSAVRGEFVPVTIAGVTFPENASRSRNAGIELGVTALPTPWLHVSAGYAFLEMELTDYTTFILNSAGVREEADYSGKRMPAVPRHRITTEAQLRMLDRIRLGLQGEWQGIVYVETGNRRRGTWYFQEAPGQPPQQVPFSAVPARALFHLNGDLRMGPATVFARLENLFGEKYVGNVVANESQARFYDPGTPASVSVGVSLTGSRSPQTGR